MSAPLDSRQLHALVTLSRVGSFTIAAKELFLTPSAISHAISELEERVGCRLLDRRRKKVELTQAGEQLLQHSERILREMSDACASLEQLGRWGKDRLRLGANHDFCQYLLPAILEDFCRSFPGHRIVVEVADTFEAVDLVRNNRIDLAITLEPKKIRDLEFRPIFSDELAFLVAPGHAWAKAQQAIPGQIAKELCVLYKKYSQTFGLIEDYFRNQDIVLNSVIEIGSSEAIKELLKRDLGVGILAPWIAAEELRDKELVALPLGSSALKRTWGVLSWANRRMTWSEEAFVRSCRTLTKKSGFRFFLD